MGFSWLWRSWPLFIVLAAMGCTQAPPDCHLTQVVSEPVLFVDGLPTIEVTIAGHPLRMMIDTGAAESLITTATARAIHASHTFGNADLFGVGGEFLAPTSFAGDMQIDGLKVVDALFIILPRILDNRPGDPTVNGLIGSDVFRHYNIALDFPHNRFRLYLRTGCTTAFPFTGLFAPEPIDPYARQHIYIPISVDGRPLQAAIDTGSGLTLLTESALAAQGIKVKKLVGLPDLKGAGPKTATALLSGFDSVTIGAEEFDGTAFVVSTTPSFFQAIIGEDYLHDHQLFISTETNTAYLGQRMDSPNNANK